MRRIEGLSQALKILLVGLFLWISTAAASPLAPTTCHGGSTDLPSLYPFPKAADFESPILAYLNALGSADGLQEAFSRLHDPANPQAVFQAFVVSRDVTGDGIADFVVNVSLPVSDNRALFVFTCQSGKFVTLYRNTENPTLRAVKEMNLDGKAEIVYSNPDCTVGCLVYFDILEWNGASFASLARNNDPPCYGPCIINGAVEFEELGRPGPLAMILVEGWNMQYGPGCEQRSAWIWNGQAFVKGQPLYCKPEYRLHAVYDGDDASLAGNYPLALGYYQQAIFESGLLPGRDWQARLQSTGNPSPPSDPVEWAVLSAYARYRILLLQILWRDDPSARLVYRTLSSSYLAGTAGYPYARLASAFWEDYEKTHDLASACSQAAQYAAANPAEILAPLGQPTYGKNNRDYQPEDICPFNKPEG